MTDVVVVDGRISARKQGPVVGRLDGVAASKSEGGAVQSGGRSHLVPR